MLNLQKQLKFSKYTGLYDDLIPKGHLLRKIKENIDFSFVNPLMKEQYSEMFGRPAYEPEMMFKALFLEILYELSDRDYEERANTDMAFKYFLDLDPEDKIPDYSLLSKFRKTRIQEDMLQTFLSETIAQAVAKGIVKSRAIIVDSTHSKSKHSPKTPTQILREMTKELRREIYKTQHKLSDNFPQKPEMTDTIEDEIDYTKELIALLSSENIESEKAKKQLRKIKETLELPHLLELQSADDSDAKIGHKSENEEFFGFKNHIAVTEDEQLIAGLVVTNGNEADTNYFEELVEQTINNGIEIDEILGDTAYSSADNIKFAEDKDIKVISKLHKNVCATATTTEFVHFNKDANTFECVMGCLAKRNKTSKSGATDFCFGIENCRKCPHKSSCITTKNDKSKRIRLVKNAEIHKRQKEFEQTDYFKERYRKRPIVEGKNADLKGNYGLDRSRSTGLFSMKVQSFLTAFTANVVKITKLQMV